MDCRHDQFTVLGTRNINWIPEGPKEKTTQESTIIVQPLPADTDPHPSITGMLCILWLLLVTRHASSG
jgi:hypothetical protein